MKQKLLLLVVALVLGVGLWLFLRSGPHRNALLNRELATRGLAEYLASRQPGQRALVLSNPFTRQKGLEAGVYAQEEAGIRGLREGFGRQIVLGSIGYPELKPEAEANPLALVGDKETSTPLSYLVAEDAFDKLIDAHPDCGVVVSLVGLPADLGRVQAWKRAGSPKFALLLPDLRMIGDAAAVRASLVTGKLVAFVALKPGAPPGSVAPGSDHRAEFDKRFLLVTADNVDQMIQQYPQLF
jgi:hypothetical protein